MEHKTKFYPSAWARYDLAAPPSLALVPPEGRLGELADDYRAMAVMIFGEAPALEDLLRELALLETKINGGASE